MALSSVEGPGKSITFFPSSPPSPSPHSTPRSTSSPSHLLPMSLVTTSLKHHNGQGKPHPSPEAHPHHEARMFECDTVAEFGQVGVGEQHHGGSENL